ncbi:MAG: hypothetical protein AB7E49_08420 [Campylobacterales bacterium]
MQPSEWLQQLKIAVINESEEAIARLYGDAPDRYESLEQAQEAAALMAETIALLKRKREALQGEMAQTKSAIAYQKNQAAFKPKRFDNLG